MEYQQIPRLGIVLPTRGILLKDEAKVDPSSVLILAQEAENAGLDSVWVGDSLVAKPRLEPLSTLAAVAMRTSHIRLGTAVLLAPLRQPVQLAQMAATVDILSSGRLSLGMGAGGAFDAPQKLEWQSVGVLAKERGARMTELVEICRRLWTEPTISFRGQHFDLNNVGMEPKPAQAGGIPMLLTCHYATGSKMQYRRAARFGDGVIGISDTPEQYAHVLSQVRGYAEEVGRDPYDMKTAFYMTINIGRDKQAAQQEADSYIRRYYGLNFWAEKWGPFGTPEEIIARILEYFEAGAQEIIVRFASANPMAQMRAFTEEVVPQIRERPQ